MQGILVQMDLTISDRNPDSKIHRAKLGPIWDRQDIGGPHGGPMNSAIWERHQYPVGIMNTPIS